jgi:hypothetical protein
LKGRRTNMTAQSTKASPMLAHSPMFRLLFTVHR